MAVVADIELEVVADPELEVVADAELEVVADIVVVCSLEPATPLTSDLLCWQALSAPGEKQCFPLQLRLQKQPDAQLLLCVYTASMQYKASLGTSFLYKCFWYICTKHFCCCRCSQAVIGSLIYACILTHLFHYFTLTYRDIMKPWLSFSSRDYFKWTQAEDVFFEG